MTSQVPPGGEQETDEDDLIADPETFWAHVRDRWDRMVPVKDDTKPTDPGAYLCSRCCQYHTPDPEPEF